MMSLLERMNKIACVGLGYADPEDVVYIAKNVWYYDFMPDLSAVSGPYRNDVGYLFDRLARFNVLTKERKLALIYAVAPINLRARCRPRSAGIPVRLSGVQATI